MRKILKRVAICFLLAALVWSGGLICDRVRLRQELIRLHVVAASDSDEDQTLKLRVRDAVTESLQDDLKRLTDPEEAAAYIQENLPKLEKLANRVLREAGSLDAATVSFEYEAFARRVYDTFTLPAGVYRSLRILIGEGEGQNWWCVVYPAFCLPATAGGFEEAASCAGFPGDLTAALEGKSDYEIRFFLLDLLGRLENLLHRG